MAVLSWFNQTGIVAPDWFSDWNNGGGTGTTQNALWDGANSGTWKWNGESTNVNLLNVIAKASSGISGWPTAMTNVLKVNGSNSGGNNTDKLLVDSDTGTKWPATAVGNYLYYRHYFASAIPDNLNTAGPHYTENHIGTIVWFWKQQVPASGAYVMTFGNNTSNNFYYDLSTTFSSNTVYRFEARIYRKSTTTCNLAFRVYQGDSGTLFQDSTNTSSEGTGNTLAADTTNGLADFTISTAPYTFQSVDLGQPGEATQADATGSFVYFGGVAMWANQSSSTLWGSSPGTNLVYTVNG